MIKNQSKRKEGEGDARWLLREVEGKGKGKDARDLSVSICFDSCLSLFSTFLSLSPPTIMVIK
jgi:hypothetical protein